MEASSRSPRCSAERAVFSLTAEGDGILSRIRLSAEWAAALMLAIVGAQEVARGQAVEAPSQQAPTQPAAANAEAEAVAAVSRALVEAYNAADANKLTGCFAPDASLMDDAGSEFQGTQQITEIFSKFIETFPGAQMQLDIESIRLAGPGVAIEEGTRTVSIPDAPVKARNRYTMVYVKQDGNWKIVSAREDADDPEPTPHERLEQLHWLVGDWVDEDADAAIAIACHWADSENFLLIDFQVKVEGEVTMESRQRVGWDPLARNLRSWVFDADGGYGEGRWTRMDDKWIIKSTAVLPDGVTGSATIFLEPQGPDKFVMKGLDRVLGDSVEPDFETVIVRKPPEPSK